ncbi:hypothetical protein M7I_3385 [Glarea lozoyensis 74030]|uniref:Uncharacterized protein n=1 Tax=Glarea lozoyensis (strain ATCC 74030 / MF5533) TaxID=1104152 RepID=H0ELC3_GLAL7|nr:hypothetical protein M7I_3385 [Glarea lozoyensis 74030]
MGCKLQRKYGFGDYTIFEKQSEIGGAWTSNKYPGIAPNTWNIFRMLLEAME